MPSSVVRTFSDPSEYAAAMRGGRAEMVSTRPHHFAANQTRIDLHRMWVQRYNDSSPTILHAAYLLERSYFVFLTQPGPDVATRGVPLTPAIIARHGPGDDFYQRTSGATGRGSMSLPLCDMATVAATMSGRDLLSAHEPHLVHPPSAALARLQRLHAAASALAEDAPSVIAHPEAARSLEQSLIEALVACLATGEEHEEHAALRRHDRIMCRFHAVLEANPDQTLYLPELCTAIGVGERTLRICCLEYLGISPKQYLQLRRMHLAHTALRKASSTATTVTDIATQYGFWSFGRFSGEYQKLFGELPSATLRKLPD